METLFRRAPERATSRVRRRRSAARRLRIGLVASVRFPIAQPFAGGLEAHTWTLGRELRRLGHEVVLFAGAGSDPAAGEVVTLSMPSPLSQAARADVASPPEHFMAEHRAFQQIMLRLADGVDAVDVVHNNSLHYLPLAMAQLVSAPVVVTLHTPPTPWVEAGLRDGLAHVHCVAVSHDTAARWHPVVGPMPVLSNGVPAELWPAGPGGGPLVWFGRMVSEKGPDLAIRAAARLGRPLVLAGPLHDRAFWREHVRPLLSDSVRYAGHLDHTALAELVGRASAVLVTPRWDEPFGLVAVEAMLCGTPVAAFDRGGLREVVSRVAGALAAPDDVEALADAVVRAVALDRSAVRGWALREFSATAMAARYQDLYRSLV